MPDRNRDRSDLPTHLRRLSGLEKADAISVVIGSITSGAVEVTMQHVNYESFGRRGPFRHPAEIRFGILAPDNNQQAEEISRKLQSISDEDLADSIAAALGKAAGQTYKGYLVTKRNVSERRSRAGQPLRLIATMSLQIALAGSD